jgi:tetratricopeptide (TPR) repeat protein
VLEQATREAVRAASGQRQPSEDRDWETRLAAAGAAQEEGKYSAAEAQLRAALTIAQGFGEHDPRLLVSLNRLAHLYYAQGKYTKAEPLYRRALSLAEKASATDNADLETSLSNLAAVYDALGRYSEAAPFHRRALALREKSGRTNGHRATDGSLQNDTALATSQSK